MLDFGWPELFLIMAVIVLMVGPKELPQIMYGLGRIVRRLQYVRYSLTQQFDDFMQEAELKKLQDSAGHEDFIEEDEIEAEREMAREEEEKQKADE